MENKKIELSELKNFNSHQLVNLYNKNVDPEIMSHGRSKFLWYIVAELKQRDIDCSAIAEGNHISFGPTYRSFLHRQKIYRQFAVSPETRIRLHFKDERIVEFNVKTLFVVTPNVSLSTYTCADPLLLIIRHDHLQTHIDATGIKDSIMGTFDHSGNFMSMSVLNSTHQGSYGILSQARTAIVMPMGMDVLQWRWFEFLD